MSLKYSSTTADYLVWSDAMKRIEVNINSELDLLTH